MSTPTILIPSKEANLLNLFVRQRMEYGAVQVGIISNMMKPLYNVLAIFIAEL